LVNFDVPYYLVGAMVAVKALVDQQLRASIAAPTPESTSRSLADIRAVRSPKPRDT
jgi:hypothetical protein